MVLEAYQDVLGKIAGTLSIMQLVAPAGLCFQIIRQGNTNNINSMYFLLGGCISLVKMRHGQLLNSSHMVTTTLIAFTVSMVYTSVYAFYHKNKKEVLTKLLKFLTIPLILITYTVIDERERAEKIYGSLCSMMMFAAMSIPLSQLRGVIKQKHTGDLSLLMASIGFSQCVAWFLYSLTLGNYREMATRFIVAMMILPQLVMFCIYPMPPQSIPKKEKDEKSE